MQRRIHRNHPLDSPLQKQPRVLFHEAILTAMRCNEVHIPLAEQVVFPEIDADRIHHTQGMDITVVTSTDNNDQARELLRAFGMPFRAAKAAS